MMRNMQWPQGISRNSLEEEASLSDNPMTTKGTSEKSRKIKRKIKDNKAVGDHNHFISDCPKNSSGDQKASFNDQKAFVGGCWSESDEEEDSKRDEICLVVLDNNEVLSDTSYYSSSSLDSESLQNEYNKLCNISLRIINKNKHLKAKNELLNNKACGLRKRLEQLERNKEISAEYESCIDLQSKVNTLSLKLASFESSSYFLQEMIENQRSQKDKHWLGFTEGITSTSKLKKEKMGQVGDKMYTVEPTELVPSTREPTSSMLGN
ncbi:hypothetical protein Tco_0267120 [Tanacetum coccineum]